MPTPFHTTRPLTPSATTMGAEALSKEAFTEMIQKMDKDGDGTVDKVRCATSRAHNSFGFFGFHHTLFHPVR